MIVSSIEWARLDSVTNFNEARVPDVAEYRSRALQRGENPRPVECADEEKGCRIGTADIAICECGRTPAASSRDDDARSMNSNGVSRHRWCRDPIKPSGDDGGYWPLLIAPRRY
jgi:hypothetical protein